MLRNLAPAGALVLVLVASAHSTAAASSSKATLRVVDKTPLIVQGTGFRSGESVRITLLASVKRTVRRTTAGPTGSFRSSFPATGASRCSGVVVLAVGSRGSRATEPIAPAPCPPPR